jgi:hypothetical protein
MTRAQTALASLMLSWTAPVGAYLEWGLGPALFTLGVFAFIFSILLGWEA